MGLADGEEVRIDDPESQLDGFVTVSEVQPVDYAEYTRRKASGAIVAEEVRGQCVYFAVTTSRHVPFDNASAHVPLTERFKAPLPGGP